MKKLFAFAFLSAFVLSSFAAFSPASADTHKQRFQQRCNGNTCR